MNRIARFVAIASALAFGVFASQGVSKAQVSNTWSSTGQMTQARTGAAAVLLTNGQILVSGGADGNGVPQATAEMYSPATGVFTALPAMNVPRANQAAIELATGDVLVTGGLTTGGSYSDSAEIFSASSQQWTLLSSSIGTGRAGHAMAQLSDGNVLIAGGTGANQVVGSIVLYNLSDQTFTPVATLITPRTGAVAAATPDGRVLIAGGSDVNGAVLASTEIFTYSKGTMTGTVSAGPTMTSARVGATATSTYDGVAVIGGNDGQIDLGTAEIFSQWTNTFQVVSGGTPRSGHFAAMLPNNGSILVMGGTGGTAVDLLEPWANNKLGAFFAASPSLVNQAGGFATPAGPGSLLAAGGTGSYANLAELYWFPTISTDKLEYAPGTPVVMTGTGFQPFEEVTLHQHEWVDQSTEDDPDATATANSLGGFIYNGYAPTPKDVGARYHLTAVGQSSGYQAQTIFGDSITGIDFANTPLDQATGACGELQLTSQGTGGTYGTIYFYDGAYNAGTGAFYATQGNCQNSTAPITQIAGAATFDVWYRNNTEAAAQVYACNSSSVPAIGILFGAICAEQTEDIYSAPTQINFIVQPGGGGPGAAWPQQPQVAIQDAKGSTVTSSSVPVTLSISASSPPGGTLSCTTNPQPASSGVAAFSGCSITPVSTSCYYLTATATLPAPTGTVTAKSACFYIATEADAGKSTVVASPISALDTGGVQNPCTTTCSTITVTLLDSSSNAVAGKAVALTAVNGNSTISAASGPSNASGVVTFTVTDTVAQVVTYTATDTTDGVVISATANVTFTVGPANNRQSTVTASPTDVPISTGASTSTITVTLEDSTGNAVNGKTVTLTGTGTTTMISAASGPSGQSPNPPGVVTFTVYDDTIQSVTYTAKDTTDNVTVQGTASVAFTATSGCSTGTPCSPTLTWTTPPPPSAVDGTQFTVTASVAGNTPPDTGSISYSVSPVNVACTITGATVTMASGTTNCVVTATVSKPNPAIYTAESISQTVTATTSTSQVQVTCSPTSVVYTGTAQTPCSAVVTGQGGLNQPLAVTYTNNINAGTATANASFGGDSNNTPSTGSTTFTITQAVPLVSISCPPSEVYNGSAWAPCTAQVSGAGGLDQAVTPQYVNNTNAGTATATASYGGPLPSNYSLVSEQATFSIAPATSTTTISCGTGPGPWSYVYTGSALTPCTATVTGPGLNQSATITYTNNTNVGTASANAGYNGGTLNDYTASSAAATFTITQASSATVSITCPTSVPYNGGPQTPCNASITPLGESQQSVAVVYTPQNTNVGQVTATANYPGDTNNAPATNSTTFNITAAVVMATGGSLTGVYNGSTQSPSNCAVTGLYTGGMTCTNSPASVGAGVGSGSITPIYTANSNFTINAVSGTWSITAAPVTATAGSYTGVYNGVAGTPTACVVTGTYTTGVTCTNSPTSVGPGVGTGTITPTVSGSTANFTVTPANGTWTITPATVTAAAGSYSGVYNGVAGTPSACKVSGPYTTGMTCTNSPTSVGAGVGSGSITPIYTANSNFTVNPVDGSWSITPAPVTATAGSYSGAYDGNTHATVPACVVAGTYKGTLVCTNNPATVGPAVGSGQVTPTMSGDTLTNYTITPTDGTWSITASAPTVTVTCNPTSVVYNGAAQTPCTATVTGVGGLNLSEPSSSLSYSSNINVGQATATYTFAGDANHAGATGTANFTITQATPTVTLTCPVSVTYNGTAQSPCSATATDPTTLLNQTLTVTYSNNTNVGTATANTTYTNADYVTVTKSATFAITTAPVTATAGSYSNFYDGLTHSPSACAFSGAYIGALTCTNNPTSVGPAVGSGTITPVYTNNSNFTITAVNGSWSITEVSSAVVVSCPPSAIYTGAALTPCTAAVTGAGNLNQTLPASDITYTNNINVGQASVTANFPGDTNHSSSSATATFNIVLGTGTPTTTTVTCPASAPYTGSAVTPCTATVTGGGAGGLNQTLTVTYTNNTNPGTAGASASFPGNATYSASSNSTTFTIALASGTPTTTVVTCNPTSIPFTGTALTPCTATVQGAGNLNQSVPVTYTSNTNAGTATASATYPGNATYATSTGTATFTITQVSSAVVVSCPASVAYTGAAVTPCSATVTGAGNLSQSVPVTYTNNINVGTATANATFPGDANHTTSTNSATFQIALGSGTPTTTTVTCNPTSVAYTGAALTPCTATVTGTGLSQPLTVTYANNTNAGTATASASYPGNSTYAASNNSATFTITQVSSTVALTCPASVAYTGSPVTPCTATATGAGNLSQSLTVAYTNNTNVGTAGASASFNGDANHTASTNSTTFQIALGTGTPTTTTIICNPTSVVYTGAAQTPCTATVTGTGLSQSLTVIYTNNTNAGTAGASASYPGDATYSPSSNSATFTITKAAATVTLSNLTQTFTGSPLPVTVTTAPTGLTVTVLYSSGSYPSSATAPSAVGSYTVTATVADPNYTGSATGTLVISSGSTGGLTFALALRSGMPEPSPYGTMVYFDLTLSGTPCPTGNVQFFVDNTASGTPVTLNGSSCSSAVTFQTATLDPGSHTVYAVYSGDTNYTGGTSNTVTHAVTADTTAVALAASATTVNVGQPVTFTVTVTPSTPQDPSAQGPEGTVTFSDGTTSIGTMTLSSSSPYTAAITTSSLAVGTHSISATFTSSDGEFTAGSSAAITVTVDSGSSGTITPTINWTNPANIVYGTPLSGTQLDATATNPTGNVTVPGTFAYTPPAGTVLPVGTVNLSVTFTPADPTTFSTQTATVTLTITPAPVTATAGSYSGTFDGNSHSPSACAVTGAFTGTLVCTDSPSSVGPAVGSGAVTPTVSGDTLANYTITAVNGSWSITQASLTPTVTTVTCNPSTLAYTGAALTPCTATVTGAGGLNQSLTVTYTNNINVGTATASASYAGSATYAASNNSATFTITQAPSTVTVTCPASVIYNSAAQTPCTATVTPAGGVSQSLTVAYTNNTNAGTASAGATYAGDASHAASSGTATFTIVKEGTTTTLTSSSSSVAPGQGVTLTAQVAPITAGTPTGTVAFYNGTTLLGTVSLTAGSATFTASSLTVGATNVLNAVYSGDSNFTTSQSSTSVVVASLDFTMTVSGPANVTVEPGGVATYQVVLTPLYGNYPGPVSFTSTGLPTGATLTLNPTTIATNGGMQTVAVTVTTPAVAMQVSPPIGRKLAPLTLALLLFPLIGVGRLRRQGRRLSRITSLLLLLGCTLAGAMVTGCASGSGSGFFTQAQKTYTINVTATSGNVQHTAAVTLVVE